MKAVLFRQHGGPEVLEYTEFPAPEPRPGEVLVRLHAAALNRMDVMVRNGWPGLKLELPHINGADGAGEVAALGEGVEGFAGRPAETTGLARFRTIPRYAASPRLHVAATTRGLA